MERSEFSNIPILCEPGIQRDGTLFNTSNWVDGQWARFYEGKPRKIGGYSLVDNGNGTIVRTLYTVPQPNNSVDVYVGRYNKLSYFNINFNYEGSAEVDRTPEGFSPSDNFVWQFELFTQGTGTEAQSYIIAVPLSNLNDNSTPIENEIYAGSISSTANLTSIGQTTAGGIVSVSPYLFKYGNNGVVSWSAQNDYETWPDINTKVIANTKILKGMNARGSDTPSVLFWTLNSLVRGVYNIADDSFTFTTINDQISLMSPNTVTQYRGIYYFVGLDQFYFYNGIVQTLPNTMDLHWFFNNLNTNQRSKVWSMVNPKYQEWWIFYPRGTATECTHAIVYNIPGNFWYDTAIKRACGCPTQVFQNPLMADSFEEFDPSDDPYYGIWLHEFGTDKKAFGQNIAIPSYIQTKLMSFYKTDPNNNLQMRIRRFEPDFNYSNTDNSGGPVPPGMSMQVYKYGFPQDTPSISDYYYFDQTTNKVDTNEMARLISLRFLSNAAGGFYQMGVPTVDVLAGDVRPNS